MRGEFKMKKVIKRDGRKELFNKEKIIRAVELSFEDVENEISEKELLFYCKKTRSMIEFI